ATAAPGWSGSPRPDTPWNRTFTWRSPRCWNPGVTGSGRSASTRSGPSCRRSPAKPVRCPTSLSYAGLREQGDRRGEGVQEVLPAHRSELPAAEEPGHRYLAQRPRQQPGVVVGFGEHVRTAAGAGEQQRPGRGPAAQGGGFPLQGTPQVLIGRTGVPDVELHGLPYLELAAHHDGSRLGIGAGDAADQEVSLAGFGLVLVDDDAQVHTTGEQFLLLDRQRRGQVLQPRQRRPPGELDD